MKILIIGAPGSGKTTAAEMLAADLGSGKPSNTSDVLIELYSKDAGVSKTELITHKADWRLELWTFGRHLQDKDPLVLVKACLERSSIVTGVRNHDEIEAVKTAGLFDVIVWIERNGCTNGPTDHLTSKDAKIVIQNNGTLEELRLQLLELVRLLEV